MPLDYREILGECRALFRRTGSGWVRWPGLGRSRDSFLQAISTTRKLREHYSTLLARGGVIWAAIAQANRNLFSPGAQDCPGNVVHSPSGYFDDNPGHLREVAGRVRALKGTTPDDPELAYVADLITDERNAASQVLLPPELTDGHEVYFSWVLFHRAWLPGSVLSDPVLPVVAAEGVPVLMPLPLTFWPSALRSVWGLMEGDLDRYPGRRERVRPRRVPPPGRRHASHVPEGDDGRQPFFITPAAREKLRELAREVGCEPFFVEVSLDKKGGGEFALNLSPECFEGQACFDVGGLSVTVYEEERDRVRDLIIDFRDDEFHGLGFSVYRRGE